MSINLRQNIWEIYTQSWAESDPLKRLELFEKSLNPECEYSDPLTHIKGYEQLANYMVELHKNVPGVRFVSTDFKSHNDHSLTYWDMVDKMGNVLSHGVSYGRYGRDGLLLQMTGFYDVEVG